MKLVIGLTGGIGSGKSTVAKLFADRQVTVIDTDQLARDVTKPGTPGLTQIVNQFTSTILLPNGTLDRTKLRKIIFTHPEQREWLEKLLHPLIREEVRKQVENASSPYCIVVIPLLFETEPNPLINRILVVDAPEEQQIARTIQRDNNHRQEVEAILKTQIERSKRLTLAHDIIYNDGHLQDLHPQVDRLHQYYLQLARVT